MSETDDPGPGRPSVFTPELEVEILTRMQEGRSLNSICADEDMPDKSTVFRRLASDKDFRDKYRACAEIRADALHEEMLNVAHDPLVGLITITRETKDGTFTDTKEADNVERSKLIVHTLQWTTERMAPKKYGNKIQHTGEGGGPVAVQIVRFTDAAPGKSNA